MGVGGRAVAGWHSAVITAQGSPELSAPASSQAEPGQSFSSLCSLLAPADLVPLCRDCMQVEPGLISKRGGIISVSSMPHTATTG